MILSATRRLSLGLDALDYRQTASITPDWERWAKFGRGAYYVILHDCRVQIAQPDVVAQLKVGELWYSELHVTHPQFFVGDGTQEAPIFDQFWNAGLKAAELGLTDGWRTPTSLDAYPSDADSLLDELKGGSDATPHDV